LPKSASEVPVSQAGRVRWVAERLYPLWRMHIARELAIGRSTLYQYLVRKRAVCGLDDSLLLLMARERIASQRRAREIAQAEKAFAHEMGRAVPTSPAGKDSPK